MIIFSHTKKIRNQNFLVFSNEYNTIIEVPVEEDVLGVFLHHFDRLSPPKVETVSVEASEGK